jgi:hypothetical protein
VVDELQLTALIALAEENGDVGELHDAPPSLVMSTGAAPPDRDEPAAWQFAPLEQATTSNVALPAGMMNELHVAPPLMVTTSKAAAPGSWATAGLPPMARHLVAEEHETERSASVPPLTVRMVQVLPPSTLTRTDAPTATQNVTEGQSTEPRAPTPSGSTGAVQEVPPSDETRS